MGRGTTHCQVKLVKFNWLWTFNDEHVVQASVSITDHANHLDALSNNNLSGG